MQIRDAVEGDIREILAIHNEVIANSTAIYAEDPVSYKDRYDWFNLRKRQGFPILVSQDGSGVTGYCSFGEFRAWPCYRYTIEHSVHVRADRRGQRIGGQLMNELVARATSLGKHVLIGGSTPRILRAGRSIHGLDLRKWPISSRWGASSADGWIWSLCKRFLRIDGVAAMGPMVTRRGSSVCAAAFDQAL